MSEYDYYYIYAWVPGETEDIYGGPFPNSESAEAGCIADWGEKPVEIFKKVNPNFQD